MKIKLKNAEMELTAPITVYEAAKEAGLITREVIGAEIGGVTVALTQELKEGDEVKLLTFADDAGKHLFRHTASHILAQAVKRLYPDTKLAIGPSIKDGFYYDFDRDHPFTEDELAAIEAEMKKITKENLKLERFTLPRAEAIALMEKLDEPYKVELINDLPEDEELSFFKQGDYVDLCAGPHVTYTSAVKAF